MTERSYPLNAWYVIAWDHEVKRGAMTARTICEKPVVTYRKKDGTAVALDDACWHRLAAAVDGQARRRQGGLRLSRAIFERRRPLHAHALAGDDQPVGLRALLSGGREAPLRLDLDGRSRAGRSRRSCRTCTGTTIRPGRATARSSREMRLPARRRQSDGPDARDLRARLAASATGPLRKRHSQTTHSANGRTVTRWMHDIEPPPFWAAQLGKPAMSTAGRSSVSRRPAPSRSTSASRLTGTGAPEGDRSQGVNGFVLNTITPETETSCHYFWAFARNYRIDDEH